MCRFLGVLLSLAIAHCHFGVAWPGTSGRDEALDQVATRLGRDQAIPLSRGEAGRFDAAGGNHHRGFGIGPVE
jgi:hypothetical protein